MYEIPKVGPYQAIYANRNSVQGSRMLSSAGVQ